MGDIVENKKSHDTKGSFKLGSFIKKKILGMYGIEDNSQFKASTPQDKNDKKNEVADLLPHDNT